MGLTKEQAAGIRQNKILQFISEPGGSTGNRMAKILETTRGVILKDIIALRQKGYVIEATSMTTEDRMYVAVYELVKMPSKPH